LFGTSVAEQGIDEDRMNSLMPKSAREKRILWEVPMAPKPEREPWLLAVDGSDDAFETVHYVSKIHSSKERQMVLFAVVSKIPDVYWDLEKEPVYNRKLGELLAWETQRAKQLEQYMAEARQILVDAGFPAESVEVKLQERQKGIARDIIHEAGKGYAVLVVGRKGVSRVRGVLLGSVAAKLLERIATVPVVLVGRDVRPGKVLVAFDGSAGSFKAVDCVGSVFGSFEHEVNLTNVVRQEEKDRIAQAERSIAEAFDLAIERLSACGITRNRISTQIITGASSRAEAIVKEADQGGYGTIAVGRRGMSDARDFSMGAVSNKVVQLATQRAVWIVS
jgi:nucleotide-binding universal stress UspA family protein